MIRSRPVRRPRQELDAPHGSAARPRRGASLVELIVAMLLLSVGLFSVLGTSGSVSESLGGGMRQTLAASIAQARIDSLTSIGCQSLTTGGATSSGSSTLRGIEESWSVEDGRNVKAIRVSVTVPGRRDPILYETIIPCRD
jgi:hypothetical protein